VIRSAPLPTKPTKHGLAIASLALGVTWLFWIGSILAIIFGYLAIKEIDQSNGWRTGRTEATAGLVLGWVGVGILLLALVLSPFTDS
jgi:hypothetical protein